MKSIFANIVSSLPADYADLRFEENRKIRIGYEGKELTQVATTLTSGGHVRVYAKGGKAISSFSDPGRAGPIAEATCSSAILVGNSREKKLKIAAAPVITEDFLITPVRDPRTVSLKEKLDLTAHYNELILRNPNVITTQTMYDEFTSRRIFVNSDG